MDHSFHIEEIISFYLDGELSGKERVQLEAHLAECESCRQLLQEQQQAERLIARSRSLVRKHPTTEALLAYQKKGEAASGEMDPIKAHLQQCESCRKVLEAAAALGEAGEDLPELDVSRPATGNPFLWRVANVFRHHRVIPAAIAVAAVVLIMVLFFTPKQNPYASLVTIEPAPYVMPETRGQVEEVQEVFRRGMTHYINAEYNAALPLLRQVAEADPGNPQYQFFFGVSLMLTQRYQEGVGYLTHPTVMNSAYREEAMWYAALGYLKMGDVNEAQGYLKQVASDSSTFSIKAHTLLGKIRKKGKEQPPK